MSRIFAALFLPFLLSVPALAKPKVTPCAIKNGRDLARQLNQRPFNDKLKHCALMCGVTLACSAGAARSLGYAKEILDLLGLGQAERADLEANERGIQLARAGRARSTPECIEQCGLYY